MGAVLGERGYRLRETRPRVLVMPLLQGRAKWKEKCAVAKIELQAFRRKVRDLEVSREKWQIQAEETEDRRRDLAQQLEHANEQNKRLEERIAALEADKKSHCVGDRIHAHSRAAVFA
jgi:chromosome segregation ATPase